MSVVLRTVAVAGLLGAWMVAPLRADTPTVQQALSLKPSQKGVEIDTPTGDEVGQCTIRVEKNGSSSGWVVEKQDGTILRRFTDTNDDNVVDRWCYFQDGVEVYRDIDQSFNGKIDNFRWLGPAGTRWGQDTTGDGKLDSWKQISAEEVSAEVVQAIADKDATRFRRVLLTEKELDALGLPEDQADTLRKQLSELPAKFSEMVAGDSGLEPGSRWVRFDAVRPGVLPAGPEGGSKDVILYDGASAVVQTPDQQFQMVQLGSVIKVGDTWKLVDLPRTLEAGRSEFVASSMFHAPSGGRGQEGASPEFQKLLADLEKLDQQFANRDNSAEYSRKRSDLLFKLFEAAGSADGRDVWGRQYADTVSVAAQTGLMDDGVERLASFLTRVKRTGPRPLVAYATFRHIMTDYGVGIQKPNPDFAKIQETYLERLKEFVDQHPNTNDTAEALLQLGITLELSGQDDDAKGYYKQVAERFSDSEPAKKAQGAYKRLDSVGKTISLTGTTLSGKQFDVSRARGRIVLIDYWATWCQPCTQAFEPLKQLQAKYGQQGFFVVGVNLDSNRSEAAQFLNTNRVPWESLFEPGGLESRLANELGILTLPTKILIDQQGRVVNRNVEISELEDQIKELLRQQGGQQPAQPNARPPASRPPQR